MANTYSQSSPYFATQLFDGKFLDVLNVRPIPRLPDDILTQIGPTYDLRPDLLAFDLYYTSSLWWVFAARNPNTLSDPLWSFRAGVQIYIPQRRSLIQALGV
jgi:hypothetical protein